MRRLFLIALALPCLAAASPRERWIEVSPPEETHGAMALELGSIHPGAQKGLDEALGLEVADAKTAWLNSYEVRCGRGLIHQIDRHAVNPKTGKPGPSLAAIADWGRPDGAGERRVLDIVCRHDPAGGDVISDRRAAIFVLGREPKPIPPAPPPPKA
jgi:hypothetical protein